VLPTLKYPKTVVPVMAPSSRALSFRISRWDSNLFIARDT
jgi:hypothetical protein